MARVFVPLLLALVAAGCNRPTRQRAKAPPPGAQTANETIRRPAKLTSIEVTDGAGLTQDLRISCVTCHSLRETKPLPVAQPADAAPLKTFHVGLRLSHGELGCASCHAEGKLPKLHLATGEPLQMTEAMTLCGQCHGPQLRDYKHGAHGGMTGHWDLSRGGRTRNHCVDCHDPHTPKFVGGRPVLPPRDRGTGDRS